MKMKKYLLFLASIFLLGGCDFVYDPVGPQDPVDPVTPTDEPVDPDNPIDPDNPTPEYAVWPEEDMKIVVMGIDKEATEQVPAFNKATEIEIDWQLYLDEGYFGIYCKTEDENSENEYKQILKDAGWEVIEEKNESSLYDAFSPLSELYINFGYHSELKELEIYVTKGIIIHWPAEKISNYINVLIGETETIIPSVEGTSYVVNYYDQYKRIAINIYGLLEESVYEYTKTLFFEGWTVEGSVVTDEYEAISPDQKVELDIYYDLEKSEFNIDVAKHYPIPTSWPSDDINDILKEIDSVGEVIPFYGENHGFRVDYEFEPPAVIVYLEQGTEEEAVRAYNQSLVDAGYQVAGTIYGEPVYWYPGTTIYYRASFQDPGTIIIEIFYQTLIDYYDLLKK